MSDESPEQSDRDARDTSTTPDSADGNQIMIQPGEHLDAEVVSAWLDTPEDFSEQDRLTIETHLTDCAECRQIAAELTAIVRAFQTLPMVATPHSFQLSPERAGLVATPTLPASTPPTAPAAPHEQTSQPIATPWYARQMRSLRWATAITSLLFVFLFSADLIGNIDINRGDDDDAMIAMEAPPSDSGDDTISTAATAADEAEESARGSAPEPTPASAEDSAAGGSMLAEEEESDEAAPESAETMMIEETPIIGEADLQQQDEFTSSDGPQETIAESAESEESNTLHLLQLALAITIAWLIVAMIALPRLRQPRQ